jgi:hypothetical protein
MTLDMQQHRHGGSVCDPRTEHLGGSPTRPGVYVPPCGQTSGRTKKGRKSSIVGTSLVLLWFSSSHCRFAASNWRRLLTQAFIAGVVVARINAGRSAKTAMATAVAAATAIIDFLDMWGARSKTRTFQCAKPAATRFVQGTSNLAAKRLNPCRHARTGPRKVENNLPPKATHVWSKSGLGRQLAADGKRE